MSTEENKDVFSADPVAREIEIALVRRLLAHSSASGAAVLFAAENRECSVERSLSAMQSPLFEKLAAEMEKSVPEMKGFGKFRSGR